MSPTEPGDHAAAGEPGDHAAGARGTSGAVRREHPAVVSHRTRRAQDVQLRIADAITAFAGSMLFVYLHAVVFAAWMLLLEHKPWPTLTLVVSLEAIFLSAFVLIGQNRQAAFQQDKANHDFVAQEQELERNTELTRLTHVLATEIHERVVRDAG
jgi:uncharacterized membrane protein